MNSRSFIDAIPDYLEGQLSAAERCAFERHQQTHPDDALYFRNYVAVIRLCRSAYFSEPVTPCCDSLVERIMNKLRQAKHENHTMPTNDQPTPDAARTRYR